MIFFMAKHFLRILTCGFFCSLNSSIAANNQNPFKDFPFTIKLDASTPIKFQPDLSMLGDDLGRSIGQFFSTGARSFSSSVNDAQYGKDMSDGMEGLARNLGGATRSFNSEAQVNLFPEMSTTFRGLMSTAINKRNVFQFGGLTALSIAVSVTGYYLTKFLWEFLSYKIFNPKPVILLPETKYGRIDRLKRWWNGYTTPAMVFDAQIKERLIEIEEKTKHIRAHNKKRKNKRNKMSYDNLLLHGLPGTGKTVFARILADNTNMDFVATTAASLLQSGVSGVKYFNDIMKMAQRSSYGLILFIDEADALFVDRDTLSPDSDHYKILSHILALTGDGNSNFMLIAATNHAYVMDTAMSRRFQDRVLMPLPDAQTRRELIDLYTNKLLFNKQANSKLFIKTAHTLLNKQMLEIIVNKIATLSHAEIKDMVAAMHKKAYASKQQLLTQKHINDAIDQAIEKHESIAMDEEKKSSTKRT
jgi:ATPase family AAA domain-containing protein 3A/B